jgi:predicted amidophosphoribosyltransferase
VDDILTTGTTLCEAKGFLESKGMEVLFALTVASAKY